MEKLINSSVVLKDLKSQYDFYADRADPRVADWPLMADPTLTIVFSIAYNLILWLGMKIMKNRAPFSLKPVVAIHNFFLVSLSAYMTVELLRYGITLGLCGAVDYSASGIPLAKVIWMFYFSKLPEFFDTFLMVLRKKNDQITFLHVYHHTLTFGLWWIGVKWVPGGAAWFSAFQNSFVHFWMYGYYFLSTFGYSPWWKRYLTQMQILQFFLNCAHAIYVIAADCPFPKWMQWGMLIYMASLIVLFMNFYIQAYVKGRRAGKAVSAQKKNQ